MTKLTVEESIQMASDIEELMRDRIGAGTGSHYAGLWGMARAMLTDDQLITMKGMLTKWVEEERKQGEVA